jgi:hypothetical protein
MTKAGEEALRSSSSSEALHYYQEGMKLYIERYGSTADPEKIAKFEKNIGIALCNKAQWAKAIEYLEKVLERWRAPVPKTNLAGALQLVPDLVVVLKTLYFPSCKDKPVSNERENEIFNLMYKVQMGLMYTDLTRVLFSELAGLRRTTRYDIAKIPNGAEWWIGAAAVSSISGISFKIADRCLKYGLHVKSQGEGHERVQYALMNAATKLCQGSFNANQKNGSPSDRSGSARWRFVACFNIYVFLRSGQGGRR